MQPHCVCVLVYVPYGQRDDIKAAGVAKPMSVDGVRERVYFSKLNKLMYQIKLRDLNQQILMRQRIDYGDAIFVY